MKKIILPLIIVIIYLNVMAQENPFLDVKWDQHRLINPNIVSQLECHTARLKGVPVSLELDNSLKYAEQLFKDSRVLYFMNEDNTPSEELRWGGFRSDTEENYAKLDAFFKRLQQRVEANLLPWCIFENLNGDFIGFIGAYFHPNEDNFDQQYEGAIELVWVINPGEATDAEITPNWGKGYATEALEGYINTYISQLCDYNYLWVNVHPKNFASAQVAKKLGMSLWDFEHKEPSERPTYLRKANRIFFKIDKNRL